MSLIELAGISRSYGIEGVIVRALRRVDLNIDEGEFVSVMGPSGSGKSTLMNVLGCLDRPTEGTYTLDGISVGDASADQLAEIRNSQIGFVFQGFNLLSRTTALENVEMPLIYRREALRGPHRDSRTRARRALEEVGLGERLGHTPSQLSGGQQQRVAIARAMVTDPKFLLADEPTGNLDTEMTLEVMGLFQALNERGKTIIMVTHEPEVAAYSRRIVTLRDGLVVSDEPIAMISSAAEDLVLWRQRHAALSENRT